MDDNTKDFSELDLGLSSDETDDTKEIKDDELHSVTDQIKEIKESEINNKIEEIKEEQNNNKKLNKTLIILIIVFSILFISLICYLVFFRKSDNPVNPNNNTPSIVRPNDNEEYNILKDGKITLECNKDNRGEKITTLKKGLEIHCILKINVKENIRELYFDLDSSSNIKFVGWDNNTNTTITQDKKTFLLTSDTPFNNLEDKLILRFVVNDITEKTGYAEIKNIVFKDSQGINYKLTNNIFAFPPEYEDKIYIYKQTQGEEINYIGSKITLNDEENLELIDTYKCSTEECEIKNNHKNNFIIFDNNKLIVYDVLLRVKQTIRIDDEKFDYSKYEYEAVSNKTGEVSGILFKSDYVSNLDCTKVTDQCIETSISGYKISYYSLNNNMFTIALDYGFVGSNIYNEYDKVLILSKDNKYGIFSYEEDNMILELSKKYTSIEYDSKLNLVKLGMYDKDNKVYYYTYYNIDDNTFKIDINNKNVKSINKTIYYLEETNKQGKKVYSLFNSKGEQLKDIPYSLDLNFEIINKTIAHQKDDVFDLYDLNGNFDETSPYVQSGLKVLKTTTSYYLATDADNNLVVTNNIGKTITSIIPSEEIKEIYDIDTMNIVKFEETNKELEIIITNYNIAEEEKNAYKIKIDSKGSISVELIDYNE